MCIRDSSLVAHAGKVLLKVIAGRLSDYFEEHFASVRHKGDATIVTTLRPIFVLV